MKRRERHGGVLDVRQSEIRTERARGSVQRAAPRFGERPAGLTSVALHSFSVLKNNGLAHITGDARPFPLTMLTGYTANERDMSQGV